MTGTTIDMDFELSKSQLFHVYTNYEERYLLFAPKSPQFP